MVDIVTPSEIQIRLLTQVSTEDMIKLYKDAGWWEDAYDTDHGFLERIAQRSALFVGAFIDDRMIGMGRALSDLCSDAFIQDIVVLKSFRKKGIGQKIVEFLSNELKKRGVDWIGLVAEPGTTRFYEKMGFRPLKDHVPMKLEL